MPIFSCKFDIILFFKIRLHLLLTWIFTQRTFHLTHFRINKETVPISL